jgi:hypothetical protein
VTYPVSPSITVQMLILKDLDILRHEMWISFALNPEVTQSENPPHEDDVRSPLNSANGILFSLGAHRAFDRQQYELISKLTEEKPS